ncbi:MAG: NUDIX hydrolase [Patescibacteria group bacterium]|nr:NUDIX hydrolase [Patescibacteria group bacterium]
MCKIGVFAIILDDKKRVLLCHRRDYDLWNLPGGCLEEGESPWDSVVREVKEETNLGVSVDKLLGIYYKPEQKEIVFSFFCSIINGRIKLTDEADKIDFFYSSELPNNIALKQKERILDAYKNREEVVLKTQKGPTSIDLIKKASTDKIK